MQCIILEGTVALRWESPNTKHKSQNTTTHKKTQEITEHVA